MTFHEEAGLDYGNAVKLCILGVTSGETSLDNDEFRKEVYTQVVLVLERNFKCFEGGLERNSGP